MAESALSNQWFSQENFMALGEQALALGMVLSIEDNQGNTLYCIKKAKGQTSEELLESYKAHVVVFSLFTGFEPSMEEQRIPIRENKVVVLKCYKQLYYNEEQRQLIVELNLLALGVTFISILISILLALYMAKKFFTPIREVTTKARSIHTTKGMVTLETQSEILELHQLIDAFNSLSLNLYEEKIKRKKLLGSYAHEIRTPLQIVTSSVEGMIDGVFHPDEIHLNAIYDELMRLRKLIDNIEKVFEIEDEILEKETFDLYPLINQAIVFLENEIKKKKIKIHFKSQDMYIYADREKIYQVILNLMSNAVKYTFNRGDIFIAISKTGQKTKISFINTSVPIPEDEVENIFDYLYHIDISRSKLTRGTGVGLAVVKAIVLSHNGQVWVQPIEGKGNEFVVVI